ncbi:MAG: GNAT family N-acetyltransferase [Oscillospiraceae bacterium]|jgi:GNAT superfamily N-acetyltransferase|nr:GNAT family N-acetyltransferase [Oscillospiraceae bacterium]
MPEITYIGPGKEEDWEETLAMMNDAFFADDPEPRREFLRILPKLYKPQYKPWEHNYILKEDGAVKATVGLFVFDEVYGSQLLKCGGIGNVAVARDSRRKGYMLKCMDAALEAAVAQGCDFSALGGQRQRYGYWGYERGGILHHFDVTRTNLRHLDIDFTEEESLKYTAFQVASEDADTIRAMKAIQDSKPVHVVYTEEEFYDVLCSWDRFPTAFKDKSTGGIVAFTTDSSLEVDTAGPVDLPQLCAAYYALKGDALDRISFQLPNYETAVIAGLQAFCDNWRTTTCEMFKVWNTEKVAAVGAELPLEHPPLYAAPLWMHHYDCV